MKERTTKEKIFITLLIVATVAAVVYSGYSLLVTGILSWHIRQREHVYMAAEAGILFLLFFGILYLGRSRRGCLVGITVVMSAFLWIHATFLPVVVSGVYLWYLCMVGRTIRRGLEGKEAESEVFRDFLIGSMAIISVFCIMSAVGVGSIAQMQGVVLVTGVGLFFYQVIRKQLHCEKLSGEMPEQNRLLFALGTAFVLLMFCIQAGRMNMAIDYDSLWYGSRSPYILNVGGGIYENLGTVGVVYTYSKGFETLTLPLSNLPSYSFLISFQLWLAGGILLCGYRCARYLMSERLAKVLVIFLSSIPGIMNMTITAKTDIITLLVQLILLEELLRLLTSEKEWNKPALVYSAAAFLFSWTLKPTALVFSTAIYGLGMLGILILKRELRWKRGSAAKGETRECVWTALLALGTWIGIWARTLLLTGMPVTSVFSSIFSRLGFQIKYPYATQSVPHSGKTMELGDWIHQLFQRLHGVLFAPQGEDMNHVIIAWGSLSLVFFGCVFVSGWMTRKKETFKQEQVLDRWLIFVFMPFLAGNLLSLAMLTQVDGNYFMLLYVLAGLCSFRVLEQSNFNGLKKTAVHLAVLVMVYSAVISSLTNWAWRLGFSPINLINRGFYDHQLVARDTMRADGLGEIWEILEKEPDSRVIAFGTHPDVLVLPCAVQSYADLHGTQGNIDLIRTKESFREYLDWADTDYIFIQSGYLEQESHGAKLISRMIEYGALAPICYANGNVLFAVDTEGSRSEEALRWLDEFRQQYWND